MRSPRRRTVRIVPALAAGALVLAACGGGDDADAPTGADDDTSVDADADPAGTPAPTGDGSDTDELAAAVATAFAGSTPLDDTTPFDTAALAGGDSVLWFWAPWCTICRSEAPDVAEVAERYGADVQLVGVPGRGELDAMREFVDDTGTGAITHLADLDGEVWSSFGVYGQPAFAFIDDGGEVEVFVGSLGGDALAERIDELIAT